MLTKLKATKNEPNSEKYIHVNYSYFPYSDKEGYNGNYYLPLPDDFDYEKWDFKPSNTVEEGVEYYSEYHYE